MFKYNNFGIKSGPNTSRNFPKKDKNSTHVNDGSVLVWRLKMFAFLFPKYFLMNNAMYML